MAYWTLDPRRPMVRCSRKGAHGVGCGLVPGTYGYHEAHEASVRWRRRLASTQHPKHSRYGWTDLYCDGCAAAWWVSRGPDFGTIPPDWRAEVAAPEGGP